MYPPPIVEYSLNSLLTNDWDIFFPWPIFNQPAAASGKRPSCDVQISVMDFTKDIASRLVEMPIKAGEFHLHRASPLSPWFLNVFESFEAIRIQIPWLLQGVRAKQLVTHHSTTPGNDSEGRRCKRSGKPLPVTVIDC
jgi:hypothetical protein